jgi:hypothetical protein
MRAAIAYIRVYTAKQGRSGLGLQAQEAALAKFARPKASASCRPSPRPRAAVTTIARSSAPPLNWPGKRRPPSSWPNSIGYLVMCTTSAA